MKVGTRPHYSTQRRFSSECYSPTEVSRSQPSQDPETQQSENPRAQSQTSQPTQTENPQSHRESARTRTRSTDDDRQQYPLRTGRSRPRTRRRGHGASSAGSTLGLITAVGPAFRRITRGDTLHPDQASWVRQRQPERGTPGRMASWPPAAGVIESSSSASGWESIRPTVVSHFFDITNDRAANFLCRCDQENLIASRAGCMH